ncbi:MULTISPECIES: hypothetical protein [unclassified Streptomyces]|uniref:hypothetical protein n=1 Tax=unclassified Streptomyces TaxID=2593676 RepID=UPI00364A6BEF
MVLVVLDVRLDGGGRSGGGASVGVVDDRAALINDTQSHGSVGAPAETDSFPVKAGDLKKASYVILRGFPCKIVEVSKSGGTVSLTGHDIFTGTKHENTTPAENDREVPAITRAEYVLLDVSDAYLTLMTEATGATKEDVPRPEGKGSRPSDRTRRGESGRPRAS